MKIKVDENTYVESDGMQFIVKRYSGKTYTNKDGKEHENYRVLGYYGTIEQLMNGLINKKTLESKATTFKELLQEMHNIKSEIKELLTKGD